MTRKTDTLYVNALAKGLQVLRAFDEANSEMSLSQIAARTGLDKSAVQRLRPFIPQDTFAPNVAMSGLAAMLGLRIFERPVVVERKATGSPALGGLRLWRTASRAFGETARIAWRARSQRRER